MSGLAKNQIVANKPKYIGKKLILIAPRRKTAKKTARFVRRASYDNLVSPRQ
jgi:hypothetical protein